MQVKKTDSEFDKEKLQERLAKLSGGVAVINVGAATEVELKDKKERLKSEKRHYEQNTKKLNEHIRIVTNFLPKKK